MSVRRAIDELLRDRAELARRLAPGGAELLAAGLRGIAAARRTEDQLALTVDLIGDLVPYLPADDPLVVAFMIDDTEAYAGAPTAAAALRRLIADIDARGTLPAPGPAPEVGPGPGAADRFGSLGEDLELVNAVRRDLLAAPARTAGELRETGGDPDAPGLIRLRRAGGMIQLPAFQFDERLRPRPVVVTVNRLLEAEADPWGVASWWLDRNSWLGGAPADLVGRVPDGDIIAAARVDLEGA
ncbi:hypothetical protein MXD62_02005 [Frankia sp. Mgl5]|uniref:hypothetical protein n=1 Tax=Frankia sp. Mgl5 TaxID=2933793 RepID=UPI00200BDA5A|nr:hypothetical protein [Frankia sp. Mgl5]MCK9925945.1 hypothetical protein [Frankia sp. Mgl5]